MLNLVAFEDSSVTFVVCGTPQLSTTNTQGRKRKFENSGPSFRYVL